MTVAAGETVPDVTVTLATAEGPRPAQTGELLGKGRVVLFGVPGAFTPTCSDHHLPGFVVRAGDLSARGVDKVVCMSVNDAFVMGAWADRLEVGSSVVMVADGSAVFTRALGLDVDLSAAGLGLRSRRFAAIIDDGRVTDISVEEGRGLVVSSAEAVLSRL